MSDARIIENTFYGKTILLVNDGIRPVRVNYDPEYKGSRESQLFLTFDPEIKKNDAVIIPTGTRHGATVAVVEEIDFTIDYDGPSQWRWIIGRVDTATYAEMLKQSDTIMNLVNAKQADAKRAELKKTLMMDKVDFGDLALVSGKVVPRESSATMPTLESPPAPAATEV